MAYSDLSEDKVAEYKDEFYEDHIAGRNNKAIREINEKLQMFKTNDSSSGEPWSDPEMRLVLLGRTGEGKSATRNLIVGTQNAKDSSSASEARNIHEVDFIFNGVRVRLIDLPGFQDTSRSTEDTATEISKVVESFSDGIHGFLFVISRENARFNKEQEEAFKAVSSEKGLFGPEFMKHCFVILAYGRTSAKYSSLDDFLKSEQGTSFANLIESTGRRVVAVDDADTEQQSRKQQKKQVLDFIMSRTHGVYSNDLFDKFKQHKEDVGKTLQEDIKEQAHSIEDKLSEILQKMSHSEIKNMGDRTKQIIFTQIKFKVKERMGSTQVPDDIIEESIMKILTEKQIRLTSRTFLEPVIIFMAPLFTLAGLVAFPFLAPVLLVVGAVGTVSAAVNGAASWVVSWFKGNKKS